MVKRPSLVVLNAGQKECEVYNPDGLLTGHKPPPSARQSILSARIPCMSQSHVSAAKEQVIDLLRPVVEPETGQGMVDLGLVKDVVHENGSTVISIEMLAPLSPHQEKIERQIRAALTPAADLGDVQIDWSFRVRSSGTGRSDAQPIKGVKNAVAVASGKGGVGKSTVAVNIATALAKGGAQVGLLDADVYGPSIPLMMGAHGRPLMREQRIVPLEAHGVKLMSIGFILDPEKALIWRGPLVAQLITQFLNDVDWGELDYLIVDLPPGTGDVQLTLAQKIPISGAVIVTTPQEVALADALKGLKMFEEVKTPVLGIIENMSGFICPSCNETHHIFSSGGGMRIAMENGVELLGQIPIEPGIVTGGDTGKPAILADPESATAQAFTHAAARVAGRLSVEAIKKPRKPMIMFRSV
jgi:ATP-binding protein involved in chromosome partitioning